MTIKKALILAPHPDDELTLAGQLIVSLRKQHIEVFIAYVTNGDHLAAIGNRRLREAIAAGGVLGVAESHIIFLGYANEWQNGAHIYTSADPAVSLLGKTHTNSIPEHPEFCYARHGVHREFTRENLKTDLKELLAFLLPELLIAPEFDAHPDHRATSLLFARCMGELLRENPQYRPLILTKSIHEGVWYGPRDYYRVPMLPTVTFGPREYAGTLHDMDCPGLNWSDRIRLETEPETRTRLLKDNIIYHAACNHSLTTAWYQLQRVINGDAVYWFRPTDNRMLSAKVVVSSGNGAALHDFMEYGTQQILRDETPFSDEADFCWTPEQADEKKRVTVHFPEKITVSEIRLFENCCKENHISRLRITVGSFCRELEPAENGSVTVVSIPALQTDTLSVQILAGHGKMGLAEMEVYEAHPAFAYEPLFRAYTQRNTDGKALLCQKPEQAVMMAKFFFTYRLKKRKNETDNPVTRQEIKKCSNTLQK